MSDTEDPEASPMVYAGPTPSQIIDEEIRELQIRRSRNDTKCLQASTNGEDLFREGWQSDVIVKCGSREWKLHRLILSTRCAFFQACLTTDFKESNSGVINMEDDDPESCHAFLEFLYTHDIAMLTEVVWIWGESRETFFTSRLSPQLVNNIFCMADKYNVPDLFVRIADFIIDLPKSSNPGGPWLLDVLAGTKDLNRCAQVVFLQEILIERMTVRENGYYNARDWCRTILNELNDDLTSTLIMILLNEKFNVGTFCKHCGKDIRGDWEHSCV